MLRGSPRRWGYQGLVMKAGAITSIFDVLDPPGVPQSTLLGPAGELLRSDLPFVRVPSGK